MIEEQRPLIHLYKVWYNYKHELCEEIYDGYECQNKYSILNKSSHQKYKFVYVPKKDVDKVNADGSVLATTREKAITLLKESVKL